MLLGHFRVASYSTSNVNLRKVPSTFLEYTCVIDYLVSAAKFIHACSDKMFSCATGLSNDSQASDQPDVAGRDVI